MKLEKTNLKLIEIQKELLTANVYMPKVYKRNARTRYNICSKLTLKTPHVDLMSFSSTLNMIYMLFWCLYCYFEQVHVCQIPVFQHYTRAERHNRFAAFIVDLKHISHLVLVFLLLLWAYIQLLSLIFHIPVVFRLIWILVWAPCPMVPLKRPVHYDLGNLLYRYFNLIIYTKITYCHFY